MINKDHLPIVSIIVPVYKAEKYIHQCVDSLLAQTYQNIEIILVDDGSPDNCGDICEEYAARDGRIRVFHKSNGGVSSARNVGLDNALGEWVLFVDSDDWLYSGSLDCFTSPPSEVGHSEIDLYVYGYESCGVNYTIREGIFTGKERDKFFADTMFMHVMRTPWAKFYRRELIGDLRFDECTNIGEDTIFNMHYFKRVRGIVSSQEIMYHYECSPNPPECKYGKKTYEAACTLQKLMEAYCCVGVVCLPYESFVYYFTLSLTRPCTLFDYFRWITRKQVLHFLVTSHMPWRFKIRQLIVWGRI